ncbi:ATP-binding protein [Variovorax sp. J22R24]|uniref:hybrid sensor histidine kinase/response regulator n=1 Tax=Variovorax gracilis TaxID=3053502 RepID=UPI002575D853|nr:hybrid sensor histidine kinase/response regulator [Variovorax sp. J22R24]MDM0109065.1 ATP-binding protein [Variovorax sp. J22R24]
MPELSAPARIGARQAWRQMWTLPDSFTSPSQEQAFLQAYCRQFAAHRRLAIVLGIITSTFFLGLDYLYSIGDLEFGHVLRQVLGNRIATVLQLVPFMLLAMRPRFEQDERYAGLVLTSAAVINFLFYCNGFLVVPYPYDYMYFFMGMCINVVFCFAMLRLRARAVLLQIALCLLAASITFAWNWQIKEDDLGEHVARIYQLAALSFLLTISTIGWVVANLLERHARTSFAQTRELARSNDRLAGRSQDIERLNGALRAAVERAERESAARARVLASASHDLRQPLHALSIYSAVLSADPGPETLREVGGHIDQIARSLGALLHGLLDLSQLSSGHYVPAHHTVALDELCRSLCSEFKAAADAKGLMLACRLAPVIWSGDTLALARVIRNLMDNAIKYTARGGLTLRLAREGACAVLMVEDTGEGIHPDALSRIFEEFYQVGNQGRDRSQGVGLGLAIVHRLVELAGGAITVQSRLGSGSIFTVKVPGVEDSRGLAVAHAESTANGNRQPLAARVYIIDDETDILQGMSMLLKSWGCGTWVATAAEEASALFASFGRPDLMIVDLRLGGPESGVELVERLQATYGRFPVLVATGETASKALRGAKRTGWPLLHKPIASEVLRAAVEQALRRSKGA